MFAVDNYKGNTATSTMSDSCNTSKSGRRKFEKETGLLATGCAAHGGNGMNKGIFKLNENTGIQKKMESAQNAMKNSKFGTFAKTEITKKEIATEWKASDEDFDETLQENKNKIDIEAARRQRTKSRGIPTAGKTREWNNQHDILDWQLKHKEALLNLYVVCIFCR